MSATLVRTDHWTCGTCQARVSFGVSHACWQTPQDRLLTATERLTAALERLADAVERMERER